jgi:hypothetical protein
LLVGKRLAKKRYRNVFDGIVNLTDSVDEISPQTSSLKGKKEQIEKRNMG